MSEARPSFDDILGPAQDIGSILGPAQDIDAILDRAYIVPEFTATDEAVLREQERQAFLATLDEQPPPPGSPFQGEIPRPEPVDMLGMQPPVTRAEELEAAYQADLDAEQEQLRNITLDPAILERRREERRERTLRRTVTPEQQDIGTFGKSNILLHTDGYVRDADGTARKANGLELLLQSLGGQTLYAGMDYEQRMSAINAEREARFRQALAEGKSREEAYAAKEAYMQQVMTQVDTDRREIRETPTATILRDMGLGTSAVGEFMFDTLPLFYEIDEAGELQNPDSWADQLAKLVHDARKAGAEAVGLEDETVGAMMRDVATMPLSMMGMPHIAKLMPIPFSAIDRDTETSIPESGLRVAADTGGFVGDIGVAHARGRTFHDELMSIPSYRESLGDHQYLSLMPAMLMEVAVPGGPIDIAAKGAKGIKLAALSGKLGKSMKGLAEVADPAKWAQARRVQAELTDLFMDQGGNVYGEYAIDETVDLAEMVRRNGEPARVVAKRTAEQLSVPYQMQVALDLDQRVSSRAPELFSFGDNDLGRLILRRAAEEHPSLMSPERMEHVDILKRITEAEAISDSTARRAALDAINKEIEDAGGIDRIYKSVKLTSEDKQAVLNAISDWRVGLEAGAVVKAIDNPLDERAMVLKLQAAIEDLAGVDNFKRAVRPGGLYADVMLAAKEGASVEDVAQLLRRAQMTTGSAPLRTTHTRMRQILSMADDVVRVGPEKGFRPNVGFPEADLVTQAVTMANPLYKFYKASTAAVPDAPETVRMGGAIESMMRRGIEELVDMHMPRDVRFVTDRVMVPKHLDTPSIRKEVGAYERATYKYELKNGKFVASDKPGDRSHLLFELDRVLPGGVTPRIQEMLDRPMDAREHAFIADAVKEAGWRRYTKMRGVEPLEATIETRMTARARDRMDFMEQVVRPVTDRVMAAVHAANRVSEVVVSKLPAAVTSKRMFQNIVEYQKKWNADVMRGWLMSYDKSIVPAPYQRALDQMANEVGLIQRQYRSTIRQMSNEARKAGKENPGKAALTRYTAKAWNRIGKQAVDRFRRSVTRIRNAVNEQLDEKVRPSEAEIYAKALFDNGDIRLTNMGFTLKMVREMGPTEQQEFIQMAEAMAQRSAKAKQWRNILRAFFTQVDKRTKADANTQAVLDMLEFHFDDAIIADPRGRAAAKQLKQSSKLSETDIARLTLLEEVANSAILMPTSDNIRKVIDFLRDKNKIFEGRGAAVRSIRAPLRGEDAILRTEQTWQMSVDQELAVGRILEDFLDQNPEFVTFISPNNGRMTADMLDSRRMQYQSPITVQLSVLRGLRALEVATFGEKGSGAGVAKGGEPLYIAARQYVREGSESPFMRQKVAGKELGPPVNELLETEPYGPAYPLQQWAIHRAQEFGPQQRAEATRQILTAMNDRGTLYPSMQGGGIFGILGSADNSNELGAALDNMMRRIDLGRGVDPMSEYMRKTVKRLRDEGVSELAIKDHLFKYAHYGMNDSVTPFLENQVRNSLRNFGFSSFATPGSMADIVTSFDALPIDEVMALPLPPGMRDLMSNLRAHAASGKMLDALEDLHGRTALKDKEYGEFAQRLIGDFLASTKQLTAYGLLSAGIVLGGPFGLMAGVPITRYIGLNILTAPMMMVGTLGAPRALTSLKMAGKDVLRRALPNTVAPKAPTDIIFHDTYGKRWTQQEFEELCAAYNIYMSRAEVDQTSNVFRTMERELRVYEDTSGVKEQQWYRRGASYLDFSREAPGMQFAVWTDTVFRRGAFAAALRDGHTPMEAAKIARAAVLDYGAVPDIVKNTLNKYVLFATFRTASTKAMIESLFAGRNEWLKVMKLQMQLQKSAGTWTFGADHDKVRSYTLPGPEFDYRKTAIAGPQEVFASAATDIIDATAYAAAVAAEYATGDDALGGDLGQRATMGIMEENLQPAIQAAMAMVVNMRPTSRGRLVPDTWVLSMKNAGLWDSWAVERFNIHEVGPLQERDDRRPGAPEFDGVQYVFEGTGYRDYVAFSYLSMLLTMQRASDDWAKMVAASPYPPDGYDPKYRAIVPWYTYMPGLTTPIRMPSPEDIHQRALNRDRYQ